MNESDRDRLIAMYEEGPDALQAAWLAVPAGARRWRPETGAWSAHEIIVHCADSETMAASRIRLLIAGPNAIIPGYDQDAWSEIFRYEDRDADLALATIRAVRANTVPVLRAMPDEAWDATGTHTESGRYRASDWLESYGNHLHDHIAQIEANVIAWEGTQ
jgi:hypothetical protein